MSESIGFWQKYQGTLGVKLDDGGKVSKGNPMVTSLNLSLIPKGSSVLIWIFEILGKLHK